MTYDVVDLGNLRVTTATPVVAGPRGAAGAAGGSDAAQAGWIEDPDSLTRAALTATYARTVDLVSNIPAQTMFAHRGGSLRYSEETMTGFRAAAQAGFGLELDVYPLADGTLVCHHDATVDRMTDGTGNVNSKTRAQWDALVVDPVVPGAKPARGAYWQDVLNEFGGRALILVEHKSGDATALDRLLDSIEERGLQRAVVVQSNTYADCQAAVARGIAAAPITGSVAPATLVADGMTAVIGSTSLDQTYLNSVRAAGLPVWVYTPNTIAERDAQWVKNADALITDDPWHLSGKAVRGDLDLFREQQPWAGLPPTTAATARQGMSLARGELSLLWGATASTIAVPQNWAGTRPAPTVKVRATIRFGSRATSDTRWGGIMIGTYATDSTYNDNVGVVGQTGYHGVVRRNGTLQLYRVESGAAATSLGTFVGSAIAATGAEGGPIIMELEVNATNVILRNVTAGTTAVVNVADTTHRPNPKIALTANAADVHFFDVKVTDL